MKRSLILYSTIITVCITLIMAIFGLLFYNEDTSEQARSQAQGVAEMLVEMYDGDASIIDYTEAFHITLLSGDCTVLADNLDQSSVGSVYSNDINALGDEDNEVVSTSELGKTTYYAVEFEYNGDTYYMRVGVSFDSSGYGDQMTLVIIFSWFATIAMLVFASNLIVKRYEKPLKNIRGSIEKLNVGDIGDDEAEDEKVISVIEDIGVKLEENTVALLSERKKLEYIINNINDSVLAVDKDKLICLINTVAQEVLGCGDAIGKNVECIAYNQKLASGIDASLDRGENSVAEITLGKSNYIVTIKSVRGWANDERMCIVVLSDITYLRSTEKMRTEFFTNANHELKSPLTSIMGFAELLSMGEGYESNKTEIDLIVAESHRMLGLVDDMLKIFSLESAEEQEREIVDLVAVTNEVMESLQTVCDAKQVAVSIRGAGSVIATVGDMYSLIKNLTENAIKYNKQGGSVDINITETERGVLLNIKDTGIGIPSQHQSRIFERFYRVEKSRSRAQGGTGLGLAIVKHICFKYNAEIDLKSTRDVGTNITIAFAKKG